MGKRKQTTESSVKPIYGKQIEGAAASQQAAYNAAKPGIDRVSGNMLDLSDDLLGRFREGDPTINAARGYIGDTLGGDPMNNPYLDDMVSMSNDSVRNQLQAQMGTRGQTGSSDYYGVIGKALGQNELGMRYSDYDRAMQRKAQAAGMAPGIVAGDYIPVAAGMQAGQQGAMLPLQASLANSAGVGGLLGQYTKGKQTQYQSGGLFQDLLGTAAQVGSAAIMACDARLKENVSRIGATDGGVPLYVFNYKGDDRPVIGPIAQEVAELQPAALGPTIGGAMTILPRELR